MASQASWIRASPDTQPSLTANGREEHAISEKEQSLERCSASLQEKLVSAEALNALLREDLSRTRAIQSNDPEGAGSPNAAVPASGEPASGAGKSDVDL